MCVLLLYEPPSFLFGYKCGVETLKLKNEAAQTPQYVPVVGVVVAGGLEGQAPRRAPCCRPRRVPLHFYMCTCMFVGTYKNIRPLPKTKRPNPYITYLLLLLLLLLRVEEAQALLPQIRPQLLHQPLIVPGGLAYCVWLFV